MAAGAPNERGTESGFGSAEESVGFAVSLTVYREMDWYRVMDAK